MALVLPREEDLPPFFSSCCPQIDLLLFPSNSISPPNRVRIVPPPTTGRGFPFPLNRAARHFSTGIEQRGAGRGGLFSSVGVTPDCLAARTHLPRNAPRRECAPPRRPPRRGICFRGGGVGAAGSAFRDRGPETELMLWGRSVPRGNSQSNFKHERAIINTQRAKSLGSLCPPHLVAANRRCVRRMRVQPFLCRRVLQPHFLLVPDRLALLRPSRARCPHELAQVTPGIKGRLLKNAPPHPPHEALPYLPYRTCLQ